MVAQIGILEALLADGLVEEVMDKVLSSDEDKLAFQTALKLAVENGQTSEVAAVSVWKAIPPTFQKRMNEDNFLSEFEDLFKRYAETTYKGLESKVSGAVRSVINEKLTLRFGDTSFDRNGITAHDMRDPLALGLDPIRQLLGLDSSNGYVDSSFGEIVFGPKDQASLPLTKGLHVWIANSGVGKTTLVKNVIRALITVGQDSLATSFIPWNEREHYSYLGSETNLVQVFEDSVNAGAEVILLDSAREFAIGGSSPGTGGMNTQFFMQLTTWHHAFADRGVAAIVVINPNTTKPEVVDAMAEALRGSVASLLTMKKRGHGVLEHSSLGRTKIPIEIPLDGFGFKRSADGKVFNAMSNSELMDKTVQVLPSTSDGRLNSKTDALFNPK